MKSNNLYRSNNPSLRDYPWLHNRPKRFVAHCIQKISLAEDISNDKITQEDELFLVKSSTSGEKYRFNFGIDEVLSWQLCDVVNILPGNHLLQRIKIPTFLK